MISCKKTRRLLSLFLTGDLGEAEARRVRLHVASCPGCRQHAGQLDESHAALGVLREQGCPDVRDSLWPELSARLARLRRGPGELAGWAPVGALAAACLAVYVLGSVSWRGLHLQPGVGISARANVVSEKVGLDWTNDVSVREHDPWSDFRNPLPVLPDASAETPGPRKF